MTGTSQSGHATGRAFGAPAIIYSAVGLTIAAFVVTAGRVPVAWGDETIYASVARSMQQPNPGSPAVLHGVRAVDHIAFYGPLFFKLSSLVFRFAGVSLVALRALSLTGGVLAAFAALALARVFGASARRSAGVALVVLLTTEIGTAATSGRMDSLAVGLALLAVACSAAALRSNRPRTGGVAAGLVLALSLLTTPRAYPFAVALAVGALAAGRSDAARRARGHAAIVLATSALVVLLWVVNWSGSVAAWLHLMAAVAGHETSDVALATGAIKDWAFAPWTLITPVGAAAALATWIGTGPRSSLDGWPRLLVIAAVVNFALCCAVFNLTFLFGVYFSLPLLVVVLALPEWERRPRAAVVVFATLILVCGGVRILKYVRAAATWEARDPEPVERWLAAHVPRGARLYGPPHFYYYAAVAAGLHYRLTSRESWADWARWAPPVAASPEPPSPAGVYLVWPDDEQAYPLTAAFGCAAGHAIAHFEPAKGRMSALGPLGQWEGIPPGYPASTLYRLEAGCPAVGSN